MQNFLVKIFEKQQKTEIQLEYSMQAAMYTIRNFGSIINSYTLKSGSNMKQYLILILLSFTFFFQHCKSNTGFDTRLYSKSTVNTMDNYQFPIGTYYKYNFSSLSETIDCDNEIERLEEENVIVKQAWYRSPLNGCSPPGSGWTTNTMYGAVFLVLLENPNDSISDDKYSILTYAPNIGCGYEVTTYKFK